MTALLISAIYVIATTLLASLVGKMAAHQDRVWESIR